jgi:integrase
MKINGKSVYLRNIRTVFNYLIDEDKINNYPFRKFKIKSEETVHRALYIEQLKSLMSCPRKEYQYKYRDIFLLMIYLIGINPKDLLNLTQDNIINERVVYRRAKTGKILSIKLEPEALHIINIYKGENHLLRFIEGNKDYLAFVRHMNKGLKNLNIIPGLTSYWARHTWASIAFEIGIPKDIISLALGHSIGTKVTDIYIRYNLEKVDEANRKVIDYINKNSSIFTDRGETKPKNESHEK